ncbi:MAG TPA: hypothetical protein VHY58_23330 [Streptosporangiaceae bacterium]|jgi:hypothetical protein|nr:hypothetical protein [Streptosporangiaceae bacterium]
MAATQQQRTTPKKKRRGLARWLTSFGGILASIATIVAAGASVLAAHQTSRVNQLTIVVKQQQQQLQQDRQQGASGSGSSGTGGTSGSSGGALPSGGVYLSAMQPTVDDANLSTGSQTMSAKAYSDSSTFYCYGPQGNGQPDEAFNVAGHSLFKAEIGIPDDAANATSLDETVIFANQAGVQLIKPIVVSLGHPAAVKLNISGVAQLEVSCTGTNTQNQQQENNNILTLGNAFVS